MTDQELQVLTEEIAHSSFHHEFKHQIFFNRRLKTTGGRYHLKDHHIDINPLMLEQHDMETLIGVIKHELVHYFLHLSGEKPAHNNPHFKQLLVQTGGLRYAPDSKKRRKNQLKLTYQCQKCGQIYIRHRHINTEKYRCGKCHGRLTLIEEERSA
ncbi:SprT family protein [Pediococcus claussenii]|uniref:SprT-like family protein n=1 Tax=Pediococcus claussenii (strain ATCC BAA-344 / DSM 14800 / JCM 18046 / KCTC 3811 / LMG 21948 / P06) TaxID=701521 RepID=G8PAT3_PEDCP|nr:SprT family protein [Pediococcus claussenii]AEV94642.1 sprT-like family protein [Pediococcus claussenii ATCC BAA-344]ANZ69845.1 SprT family protein [Pediococcus claussenii]ANZ71662.1 SprT family protein [Pediococcus claussenii]KRN20822.1 hypothetical protein IV79_GL000042 [Pediococcus claussenii]